MLLILPSPTEIVPIFVKPSRLYASASLAGAAITAYPVPFAEFWAAAIAPGIFLGFLIPNCLQTL